MQLTSEQERELSKRNGTLFALTTLSALFFGGLIGSMTESYWGALGGFVGGALATGLTVDLVQRRNILEGN